MLTTDARRPSVLIIDAPFPASLPRLEAPRPQVGVGGQTRVIRPPPSDWLHAGGAQPHMENSSVRHVFHDKDNSAKLEVWQDPTFAKSTPSCPSLVSLVVSELRRWYRPEAVSPGGGIAPFRTTSSRAIDSDISGDKTQTPAVRGASKCRRTHLWM